MTVAGSKGFSEAARKIHITQSALSQRILNLEEELEVTLFLREPMGVRLTEIGEALLRYCQMKNSWEKEFLGKLKSKEKDKLSGHIKIAAFSTYARSVLLPELGQFGRKHPQVQIDLLIREVRDLPHLLKSGQADFVFTTRLIEHPELISHEVGFEENVLIQSRRYSKSREEIYIDHDEFDTTTQDFWKAQKSRPSTYRRIYFDEIYTIIDAVAEGLGKAVVPRHLVENDKAVSIVDVLKPLKTPVYLIYYRQEFYTALQKTILESFNNLKSN